MSLGTLESYNNSLQLTLEAFNFKGAQKISIFSNKVSLEKNLIKPSLISIFFVLSLLFNFCFLPLFCKNVQPLITKGAGTYGEPTVYQWGEGAHLTIGKYCSIGSGVVVMLGGNHRTDWVTTYPFNVLWPRVAGHIKGHPATKGDVIIGNDVWIGMDALILSGVKIADGAVVAARAVVSKDVPPYAIVAGNPARVVKMRFCDEVVTKLLSIGWWNWPEQEIEKALPFMLSSEISEFIDYCE